MTEVLGNCKGIMNWRQAVMNWSHWLHDLKSLISWIELPYPLNAVGNSWTEGSIHGVSQFMPIGQFIVLQEIKKHPAKAECFLDFDRIEIISWSFNNAVWYREYRVISCDIVVLSCDFVRYREHREYRLIKCCTKFAPKSHHIKRPFSSTNWNLIINIYFYLPNTSFISSK